VQNGGAICVPGLAAMGVVYAIWSGVGMVMIVAVGWTGHGQRLDQPALFGVALIVAGVTVLNCSRGR
jgi:multidrug transporter EmrE-like cation transporter